MAVLGIVAEFNPFHNGHFHLIREMSKYGSFSAVICVMSGDFLQRGEPAICSKWARAQMALHSGADIVIELPCCFAIRSAYYFARGAIELLSRTGVVTHLGFGTENGDLQLLNEIAFILAREPETYKYELKKHLAQGLSFPAARTRSLQNQLNIPRETLHNTMLQPNNILAIEYLRVIKEKGIPITPLTIARIGSYHSMDISEIASASAIRRLLLSIDDNYNQIKSTMPQACLNILEQEIKLGRSPVFLKSLEQSLLIKLRTMSIEQLEQIYEISEGLEYRIQSAANNSRTLSEFKQLVKTKRYNATRISRTLLYILLAITKKQMLLFDQTGPQYLHILGFSTKGQKILQEIKLKSSLRILNRGSDVRETMEQKDNPVASQMMQLDVTASNVYSLLFPNPAARKGGTDFQMSPFRS